MRENDAENDIVSPLKFRFPSICRGGERDELAPKIGASPLLCRLIEAAAVAAAVAAAAADPAVAVNPLRESTFVSVNCLIDSLPKRFTSFSEEERVGEENGAKIDATGSDRRHHEIVSPFF